ncbi:terminase large subunit domain-containing protein [Brevibacterium sp.]|uniref:terminase large subunit domain-containing protein n=1 Tax=Brevibacterium sp. TaxID=1701 RepID=UPI002811D327|nr:terminase large subunit [Brevibacterium sp.]
MARTERKGHTVPRIFTPPRQPLEPRSPETEARTFGYSVIDFAEQVCGITLSPWQQWLLIHALEREGDGFRFKTVVVLVARQSGKSTLSQVLSLWSMYVYPHLTGLDNKMTVLGTAQDLDTAEAVWEGALDIIDETPDLAELAAKPIKVNGKKAIRLLSGEVYKVKAANRKAGRGLSGDLIILDELREHQTWDAWGAITKTTIARPKAQVWALSNAGDTTSVVLRHLRKMAHKALGDPDGICKDDPTELGPTLIDVQDDLDEDEDLTVEDFEQDADTLGLFEWSAPPGCDIWDRNAWAQANPALGYGHVTERSLASAAKTDPEWVFRTECLCQWAEILEDGPFETGAWDKGLNEIIELADGTKTVAEADKIVGDVYACVDMGADRSMTYVAFAGRRADGKPQVEIVTARRGTDWLEEWFGDEKRRGRIIAVTGQAAGAPISPWIKAMSRDPDFPIPTEDWTGGDLSAAHGITADAVRDGYVRHNPQPILDLAAATAQTKQLGDAQAISRSRSPSDAAPLIAFEGALWLLLRHEVAPPPPAQPPAALEAEGREIDDIDHDESVMDMGF